MAKHSQNSKMTKPTYSSTALVSEKGKRMNILHTETNQDDVTFLLVKILNAK
jgi:hypothetical protein